MPPPSHQDLVRDGWQVVEERGPSLLLDGAVLITGQVERVTDFEKGFPIDVRGKGLVVLSSSSHSGIINVLEHARQLTGVQHVHACVGGLHLTGGLFEQIIPRTVDALRAIGPDIVVPGHCTGWKATNLIVSQLPDMFVQSNVGTRLHFAGAPVESDAASKLGAQGG
jgi:7,8-dihydropterin-6-yl-methyl-4-(beta-D-ribofuranosyl)aminobenzene 5'-phosphate synthase